MKEINPLARLYRTQELIIAELVLPDNSIVSNQCPNDQENRMGRRRLTAWLEKKGRLAWGRNWKNVIKDYGFEEKQ